jgi:hypothetical protein
MRSYSAVRAAIEANSIMPPPVVVLALVDGVSTNRAGETTARRQVSPGDQRFERLLQWTRAHPCRRWCTPFPHRLPPERGYIDEGIVPAKRLPAGVGDAEARPES